MKLKVIPPGVETKLRAAEIINNCKHPGVSFGEVMEKLYSNADHILPKELHKQIFNLSPGTSEVKTFGPYIKQIQKDFSNHKYYRNYSSSKGEFELRKFFSDFENFNLQKEIYDPDDFVVTEGATSAISQIFEYFKGSFPDGEVIIPIPSYYVFKLCAKYRNIKYKEVLVELKGKDYIPVEPILEAIDGKTKMIVLCQPNNPLGIGFKERDIKKILIEAKNKNIIVLADEVFLELYLGDNKKIVSGSSMLALKTDCLKQLITIKSLSKNRNLPGLRMGYLFSKNMSITKKLGKSQEERSFFSTGSNFRSIFFLDCIIQTVLKLNETMTQKEAVNYSKKIFKHNKFINNLSTEKISCLVDSFKVYFDGVINFYNSSYSSIAKTFGKDLKMILPKKYAFNTFAKIDGLSKTNYFDFCLNLFLSTGIMHDSGPCFGLKQKDWQINPNLGYWMRISYSRDQKKIIKAIKIFRKFKKEFLKNPEMFMLTNNYY